MFCTKCGNILEEIATFCSVCGTKIAPEVKSNISILDTHNTRDFTHALTLYTSLCFLRLFYAFIWTIVIIMHFSIYETWMLIWNIIWTVVSYIYTANLFLARHNNQANIGEISWQIAKNRKLSLFGVLWYGGQWLLFSHQGYYVFFSHRLIVVIEIAIVVVSFICIAMLDSIKSKK